MLHDLGQCTTCRHKITILSAQALIVQAAWLSERENSKLVEEVAKSFAAILTASGMHCKTSNNFCQRFGSFNYNACWCLPLFLGSLLDP